jgi:hypothetical protein
MHIWLSFLVCTIGSQSCHTTIPNDEPFVGLSACQVEGMTSAASWTESHPGWHVAKIRCSVGNKPPLESHA